MSMAYQIRHRPVYTAPFLGGEELSTGLNRIGRVMTLGHRRQTRFRTRRERTVDPRLSWIR